MTAPRLIRPHATYAIMRRVERRRFFLRPDKTLTALFTWCLAVAAEQFGIEVHVATVMSTHFHLVVTVANENVSDFMQALDVRLARAIQVLRRYVRGVVWEPGKLNLVELHTPEAIVEAIAYAIVNPVACGAVYSASDWPGLTAKATDLGVRVLTEKRPDFYFRSETSPDVGSTPLVLPACLRDMPLEQAHAILQSEVDRQEAEARAFVKDQGWSVMGRVAVQSVSPYKCAKSWEEIGMLVPHIAAGRGQKEARIAAIEELKEFRLAYAEAYLRWRLGNHDVVFPAGTYAMRKYHGASVAPFA